MTIRTFRSLRSLPRLEQLEDRRLLTANVTPQITSLEIDSIVLDGDVVQLKGEFSDPDLSDQHKVIVEWNDGGPISELVLPIGDRSFELTREFPALSAGSTEKTFSIEVTVSDGRFRVFADEVVDPDPAYDGTAFRDPNAVLGEPTRFTSPSSPFGSATTPFSGAFGGDELLSLNDGEQITVKFPSPILDNPVSDNFGIDFLVFGNAFYVFDETGGAGGLFANPGALEVSQNGIDFFPITTAFADSAFPTNGFLNPTGPSDPPPADAIPSDFSIPVDPSFDPTGLTLEQIIAGYNGSGGGTPVDIAETGLSWIQYVRVSGAPDGVEVDAFSAVDPTPPAVTIDTTVVATGVRVSDRQLQVFGTGNDDNVLVSQFGGSLFVVTDFAGIQSLRVEDVDSILVALFDGDDDAVFSSNVEIGALIYGGSGADFLLAGSGNDIVDGGQGQDVLLGGAGRDILIGGLDRDFLFGNSGSDLLIGDTFVPADGASKELALASVQAEWTSDKPFAERSGNVTGEMPLPDRFNDGFFLVLGETVIDDGEDDFLFGGLGRDLLIDS